MIDKILRHAEGLADETEILIAHTESIGADLKQDNIAIGGRMKGSGIIIRVIRDGKIGVSCTDNPQTWEQCLNAAVASSKFSDPVPWKGLPGPEPLDLSLLACDDRLKPDPALIRELIDRMKSGSELYQASITSGSVSMVWSEHTLANSQGLEYSTKGTQVHVSLEMIAGQSTGYESDTSWSLDMINPEKTGEEAAFYASKGQGGGEISTGTYDIVLSPIAISQLIDAAVTPALSGRNVHSGRSFFAGKLGESVAGEKISLIDRPLDPRGIANCTWDGEGMPVRIVPFIEEGILKSYAYDLRTAYRYDQQPTASAVRSGQSGAPSIGNHNLILEGPEIPVLEDDAIFVHDLIGAHTANPMSGDFSVEISSPFHCSDGELTEPVKTGMISGNVFDILQNIEGCSRETRTLGSLIIPSVRISGMSVIGRG